MMDGIRVILSPFFIISYVFGAKVIEFPAGEPRPWFSILYILLLWSVYYFLLTYTVLHHIYTHSASYHFCLWLDMFTAMSLTILALYYDKKFRNCLRKLVILDNTLEKLGIITDYQKLYKRILITVFGWLLFITWSTGSKSIWYKDKKLCGSVKKAIYVSFMLDYCSYLNLVNDLIIASILGYIELKFDQINEYVRKSERNNEYEIRKTWDNLILLPHQTVYSRSKSSKYITWIVIHLHLELRKISRELDSIFGLQMSIKMGTYFAFISLGFRQLFDVMLVNNYVARPVLFFSLAGTIIVAYIFRLLLINYMCERVSVKANATGDLINSISYHSSDIATRENILQLVLQLTQAPVKFYGLGLFQFGFKFLYGFCSSVATVIVILVQSHTNG